MKKILFGLVLILLLTSCTKSIIRDSAYRNFRIGKRKKCNAGSVMLKTQESFVHYQGERFEYVFEGKDNGFVSILCKEYSVAPVVDYTHNHRERNPVAQPFVSHQLQYSIPADSLISFMDFHIKIHEVDKNKIEFTVAKWDNFDEYKKIKKREKNGTYKKRDTWMNPKKLRRGRGLR